MTLSQPRSADPSQCKSRFAFLIGLSECVAGLESRSAKPSAGAGLKRIETFIRFVRAL
jgi:hypothetical protein